ncbi:MAG TPA: FAD-dependent oxidoreductase [Anaerolineales bacterium]|nr:FAD-dependent oxidoreductase [Anaerolineales bacterium]
MSTDSKGKYLAAVIGAGPAGLFAARQLAAGGAHVVLLNRDIKPGGLAEYGIYHDKHKMKEGLRRQFRQILDDPNIEYYGNVAVGRKGDLSLSELRAMGFQALLVTVGAQGTKWLGLPGEDLSGVYHAKDLVYHYNQLPPFSTEKFTIGKRVAAIGVGNVMLDIAHWLVRDLKVDEVIAVARRGPAEVKFTKKELETVARNLDLQDLEEEFGRCAPVMQVVGQDIEQARAYFYSALPKALEPVSETRFRFDFLASPSRITGGEQGVVRGLEVEDTTLVPADGDTKAKRLGTKRVLPVDTVIFCIGDRVDENFGLAVRWNEFVKNPEPRFPVDGLSYEAFDPDTNRPVERVFVAGWSREASSGLVGVARKDGESGAQAVLAYLKTQPALRDPQAVLEQLHGRLARLEAPVVDKEAWQRLEAAERAEAERLGLEEFKFKANAEMLEVMGREVEEQARITR